MTAMEFTTHLATTHHRKSRASMSKRNLIFPAWMALLAILLAVLADQVVAGEGELKAEKAIEAMGGRVVRDDKTAARPIIEVNLGRKQVTDAGLKEVAGLKHVQAMYLGSTKVTDAGLKELERLKQLQMLYLDCTDVTDAGLKELARLKQLQTLYLGSTKVTDAGLRELTALKQLHTLYLGSTKVTDAGLKELAGVKPLEKINRAEKQGRVPGGE